MVRDKPELPETDAGPAGQPPMAYWLVLYGLGLALIAPKIVGLFINTFAVRDFTNLWVAGKMALAGSARDIYDITAFQLETIALTGVQFDNSFSYPPHTLLLAAPFGALPLTISYVAWSIASLVFFYWAARPYISGRLPVWFAIMTPATLMCLIYGHYTLFLGSVWLLAFRSYGVAAAAMTIKPHFGFLSAVHLLRHPAQFVIAAAGTIALIGLSIALFGAEAWQAYFTTTFDHQTAELSKATRPSYSSSMVAPQIWYGWIGQIAFAVAAIVLLYRDFNVFTAATATFLISPYGYHYDLTVICLAFTLLIHQHWSRLTTVHRIVLAAVFLIPGLMITAPWIAPPLLLIGLFLQVRLGYSLPEPAR